MGTTDIRSKDRGIENGEIMINEFYEWEQFADKALATNRVLDFITADVENAIFENFEKEQSPEGVPWPSAIEAMCEGRKTLQKTGSLLSSIVAQVTSEGIEVNANHPFAGILHDGATMEGSMVFMLCGEVVHTDKVVIPPRPFMGLSEDSQLELANKIERYYEYPAT